MKTTFISYDGYPGDEYYSNPQTLVSNVSGGKIVGVIRFFWLSTTGFGPGYFNNSGKYALFAKVKTKLDNPEGLEALKTMYRVTVYETQEEFDKAKANIKAHAKYQNKNHPY